LQANVNRQESLIYMLFFLFFLTYVPPWPWNINSFAAPPILAPIPEPISASSSPFLIGANISPTVWRECGANITQGPAAAAQLQFKGEPAPTLPLRKIASSSNVCEGLDGNFTDGNFTNAVGETGPLEHFQRLSGSAPVSVLVIDRPPTPTGLPPRHARVSTGYHGPAISLSFRWQKISPSNRTSRFFPFRQLSRPLSPTVWPSVLSRFLPTFSNFAQSVVLQDICFCRERMGYNISRTSFEDGFFFQGGTSVLCSNAFSDCRSTTQPPRLFSLVCAMRSNMVLLTFRNSVRAAKYDLWKALCDRGSAVILSGLLSMWDCICFTYLGAILVSSIHTSMWDWCAYGVITALLLVPFWVMKPPAMCPCAKPDTKTGVIF